MEIKRTYKTIKWVLKNHIKNNVKSLWTYKEDNFTCIYKNYSSDSEIYTPSQMLILISGLIKKEGLNDKA
jgi:hypothetical protein|tara:strand:+ start:3559 stop:3768 length:210 start_codon:yes stop_codon:yes gene_type:complete